MTLFVRGCWTTMARCLKAEGGRLRTPMTCSMSAKVMETVSCPEFAQVGFQRCIFRHV